MRTTLILTLLAVAVLGLAAPAAAQPDVVSTGSPCLNGGVTLIVLGNTLLECWKPWSTGPMPPDSP
jgi:hypothetical protein